MNIKELILENAGQLDEGKRLNATILSMLITAASAGFGTGYITHKINELNKNSAVEKQTSSLSVPEKAKKFKTITKQISLQELLQKPFNSLTEKEYDRVQNFIQSNEFESLAQAYKKGIIVSEEDFKKALLIMAKKNE